MGYLLSLICKTTRKMADGLGGRRVEKHHLLGFNLFLALLDLIVIALAGYVIDKSYDGGVRGANGVSFDFAMISLIAGMFVLAQIFSGISHYKHFSSGSVGSASTTALLAWLFTLLAFGWACKEIDVGHTGSREQALEAFVFILAFFETIYVLLLHAGLVNDKWGVGY